MLHLEDMASPIIHWVNSKGAYCGAPDTGATTITPYTHAVTCPECNAALRADAERRRLAMRRLSIAVERLRSRLPEKP